MKLLIGTLIGAGLGFLLGYFGKCSTGVCPLTKNPWISTTIGALMGLAIASGK